MFTKFPEERRAYSWVLVGLWLGAIYLTIPLARSLQGIIANSFGRETFLWLTVCILAVFTVFIIWRVRLAFLNKARISYLLACLLAFGLWIWNLKDNPEQCIHFIQYGGLSLLVYRALLHNLRDQSIFLIAALICAIAGTIDEIIQWYTPGRYFDFLDIFVNTIAAVLVQILIFGVVKPEIIHPVIEPSKMLLVFLLILTQIGLIFCILQGARIPVSL